MTISFVISNCPRKLTGGHKVIFEYINYLAQKNTVTIYFGYEEVYSRFYIPKCVKSFLAKNVTKYFRPRWFIFNKNVLKKCVRNISNVTMENADVVIATDVKTAYPVYKLSDDKGKKYYFIQGFENWVASDEYIKDTYRLNMNKIVVSKWLMKIVSSVSEDRNNVYYVTNSINTDVFKDLKLERKKHSIVFQYRSNEAKGCRYALEVIDKLRELYSDLEVTIISNEKKDDMIPRWCKYVFNASQFEVARINNQSEIFLCTSVQEGFGLPGLEAMACGCALVSTDYEGVLEYAIDEVNALLSPVRDVNAMLKNIVNLFEDDGLKQRIVENGVMTGKQRSLTISAKKFERILMLDLK